MSSLNGAHTTFPMPGMPIAEFTKDKVGSTRDIVLIVDEAILNECGEARQMVWLADVTIENRPMVISNYTVPEASGSFCQRGGRFGAHSSSESMAPVQEGSGASCNVAARTSEARNYPGLHRVCRRSHDDWDSICCLHCSERARSTCRHDSIWF